MWMNGLVDENGKDAEIFFLLMAELLISLGGNKKEENWREC